VVGEALPATLWRSLANALLCLLATACASRSPPPAFGTPTQAEWTLARQRLLGLRAAQPQRPFVENVRVVLHEPRSGRTFEARGAVAVDPHKAMRMILVGPGGATALDAWTTPERWRVAIPALGQVRRGRGPDDALPIGFFRWWFLAPFDGRLLTARAKPGSTILVLRQGSATITMLQEEERGRDAEQVQAGLASRREGKSLDRLAWLGHHSYPGPGDSALYEQPSTGLHIQVEVESVSEDAPDPEAFEDPDRSSPAGARP
jgi:hypothetical protein